MIHRVRSARQGRTKCRSFVPKPHRNVQDESFPEGQFTLILCSSMCVCVCVCVCGLCWQLIYFFLEYGSAVPGIDYRGTTGDAPHRKLLHSLGPLTLTAWKVLSTQSRTETEHLLNYLSTVSGTEQVVQTRPQKDENNNNESIQITFRSLSSSSWQRWVCSICTDSWKLIRKNIMLSWVIHHERYCAGEAALKL